jgi:hypothetical protein
MDHAWMDTHVHAHVWPKRTVKVLWVNWHLHAGAWKTEPARHARVSRRRQDHCHASWKDYVRVAVRGMWLVCEGLAGTESVHNRCVFLGRVYVARENVAATYQREGRPRGPT